MAFSLTVGGYTFENPPEDYVKILNLNNNPQRILDRDTPKFYHPNNQNIRLQVEGSLALNPPLGESSDDVAELDRLQQIAIDGGVVNVDFDPFFSGEAVIRDDPFRQEEGGEAKYQFIFTMNTESTNNSAYPSHAAPDTGNTFQIGNLDLGYEPENLRQNYDQAIESVTRLQGVDQTVDNRGMIPTQKITGKIDGGGQAQLWDVARQNDLKFLQAEFQNGYSLFSELQISNDTRAPQYLEGMFTYEMELYMVRDSDSDIGQISTSINTTAEQSGTYNSDELTDGLFIQA